MKLFHWFRNSFLIAALLALPGATFAQIGISITVAPPPLPVYEQPICPEPNYMWTPGYWAWGDDGYYWVPGTWVAAPEPGLLWTPGYWGWNDGSYAWNAGYWGPEVGFYGGIDYGFGYTGDGFYGGRWSGGYFDYNTAVMNVDTTVIHNTYVDRTVVVNNGNAVSFNGGRGGIQARPSAAQMTAFHQKRFGPSATQTRHASLAREDRQNYASVNRGDPPHAAMARPARSSADFSRAEAARGARPGNTRAEAARPENRNAAPTHNGARPENHTAAPARNEARPGGHTAAPARNEARPEGHTAAPARNETHTATRPETRTESRPATRTEPRSETHTTAPARTETHAAPRTESHPAPAPRAESHPAPAPRAESHPAPAPKAESHPAPATRTESHPAAKSNEKKQPQ